MDMLHPMLAACGLTDQAPTSPSEAMGLTSRTPRLTVAPLLVGSRTPRSTTAPCRAAGKASIFQRITAATDPFLQRKADLTTQQIQASVAMRWMMASHPAMEVNPIHAPVWVSLTVQWTMISPPSTEARTPWPAVVPAGALRTTPRAVAAAPEWPAAASEPWRTLRRRSPAGSGCRSSAAVAGITWLRVVAGGLAAQVATRWAPCPCCRKPPRAAWRRGRALVAAACRQPKRRWGPCWRSSQRRQAAGMPPASRKCSQALMGRRC
mmetsp:Transcript_57532/g.159185  ORF Transcript_57532/g.159185 Transcript_57532/m.159185 type:complete len:265 (+) Transcript_57532:497-1291(+)